MLPSPQELIVFNEIAICKNITRAAERLGLTQPTLSQSLKKLEDNVGQNLVIRSKNGIQLTVAGKTFLSHSHQLVSQWERVKTETERSSSEVRGNVKIGCHPSVGLYSLDKFIPSLIHKYKLLNFTFVHELSRKITEKIISFEIDMGLVINPVRHPDLVMIKIFEDEVGLWQGVDSEESVLLCHPELAQTQDIQKKLKKQNIKFSRTIYTASLEILCKLAMANCGAAILPTRVVKAIDSNNKLTKISQSPIFKDELFLVYRAENRNVKFVKMIHQEIISTLKMALPTK